MRDVSSMFCFLQTSAWRHVLSRGKYRSPPNGDPTLGCLFGNPLSGGPKLLRHDHDSPGG